MQPSPKTSQLLWFIAIYLLSVGAVLTVSTVGRWLLSQAR